MRCRGVLSVIVKLPEMHIPPWYWFRRHSRGRFDRPAPVDSPQAYPGRTGYSLMYPGPHWAASGPRTAFTCQASTPGNQARKFPVGAPRRTGCRSGCARNSGTGEDPGGWVGGDGYSLITHRHRPARDLLPFSVPGRMLGRPRASPYVTRGLRPVGIVAILPPGHPHRFRPPRRIRR